MAPNNTSTQSKTKLGPEPTLLSRRQVDALYSLLGAVTDALKKLEIPYILTGGSLLGAIRQHSILFCDDDIDIAILESEDDSHSSMYERAKSQLPLLLGDECQYSIRPWEGGDKVRMKSTSNVHLDIFVIRKYTNVDELMDVIGVKANGQKQSNQYVQGILNVIKNALHSQGEQKSSIAINGNDINLELPCPIWHFNTRKAIELWPKEVYRTAELFPTIHNLKMGPVTRLSGPRTPMLLLKRAFNTDCFDVYYQSIGHGDKCAIEDELTNPTSNLPPRVLSGGVWSQSVKTELSDEHYIPMQPISKAKRRHTLHDKDNLFAYLRSQSEQEMQWLRESEVFSVASGNDAPVKDNLDRRTVYMDGVFDLFHVGHLSAIQQCATLGERVIIGVTGDADASSYKRPPIMSESDRTAIIKSLTVVDDVVCPCPLVVTKEFMKEWDIDLVVHGFHSPEDKEKQREFFQVAMDEGKFQEIEYYSKLSTTDIIRRIQAEDENRIQAKNGINPKWFGAALSAATDKSAFIPYNPFPLELRQVIEQQLRKATKRRQDALNAIRVATGASTFDETMAIFHSNKYSEESQFYFDTNNMQLRETFLQSCGLSSGFELSRLHECPNPPNFKDEMLFALAKDRHHFQIAYDDFVRSVCCPYLASHSDEPIDEIYYQSFPVIRVVRPGDFSIGPHADISYGHHPASINFYLPLTKIEGSASLFLESKPGSEDWHPIEGQYGMVKHFAGAICVHFTPENKTNFTRVSLDFRLIPGPLFNALSKLGGKQPGGARDVYREKDGFYSRGYCKIGGSETVWNRDGPLQTQPDARFGFPWTKVKPTKPI